MLGLKYNTHSFIQKCKEIHMDRYDYSMTTYNGMMSPIIVKCSVHGYFRIVANKHLNCGQGCSLCKNQRTSERLLSNTQKFIEKALLVHGYKYDYSETVYKCSREKVIITCPEHGDFLQTPNNHLRKKGCPKCGDRIRGLRKRVPLEKFISRSQSIHGNIYDYSKVDYINNSIPIDIICKEHGSFKQAPGNHLSGKGCPLCGVLATSLAKQYTQEEFIERSRKVHGDEYDYSMVVYKRCDQNVIIVCKRDGPFEQTPRGHLRGHGCPNCGGPTSRMERKWLDFLGVSEVNRSMWLNIGDHKIIADAYVPETNTVYEFFGDYWHGNPEIYDSSKIHPKRKISYGDLYRETMNRIDTIRMAGYNLVYIWENEFLSRIKAGIL